MQRMRRATGILLPAMVLVLAACGSPDTGGQASDGGAAAQSQAVTSQPAAPAGSTAPSAGGQPGNAERVDVFTLTQDPGALAGSQIRVLARVDEVVTENETFYTSPGGGDEGRLLVVVADDATVDKEIAAGVNVFMTGTVTAVGDLASAGVSAQVPDDYQGEWAFVATRISDPLADAGS